MAKTFKFGENGKWATKTGSSMAYNDQNGNFKPMPFSVTRDSIATRVNKQGLIEVVGNDKLRIDYKDSSKGVALLELARTNLMQRSEELDNGSWSKTSVTVTANQGVSPDGNTTADEVSDGTLTDNHRLFNSVSITTGLDYTASVFAKYVDLQYIQLTFNSSDFNATQFATFDIKNGLVANSNSGTASIINYGNGWYRCIFTETSSSTNASSNVYLITSNSASAARDPYYTGGDKSFYCWGFMVEQGSYATSYIPTSGSTVEREADVANGAGNAQVFNDSEGVLFANIAALANDGTSRRISLSSGSTSQRVSLEVEENANDIQAIVVSTTSQVGMVVSLPNVTLYNKIAFKYKENDFSIWGNGFELDTDIIGNTPVGLSELAFDDGGGGADFYGKAKEIGVYDTALTDAELEALTSYTSFTNMANELNLTIK